MIFAAIATNRKQKLLFAFTLKEEQVEHDLLALITKRRPWIPSYLRTRVSYFSPPKIAVLTLSISVSPIFVNILTTKTPIHKNHIFLLRYLQLLTKTS